MNAYEEMMMVYENSQKALAKENFRKSYEDRDSRIHNKGNHVVGEKLYLYTPCSNSWVSMCKDPYTVESVKGNIMVVREARCIFPEHRYFDTLPTDIVDDPNGKRMKLRWSEKKQRWQETPADSYPKVAVFGEWKYQPYLD